MITRKFLHVSACSYMPGDRVNTELMEVIRMTPTSLLLERRERRLTQQELGRRVGISPRLISFYERGDRRIGPERAIQIMRAMQSAGGPDDPDKAA